jgi:hypothetical protein
MGACLIVEGSDVECVVVLVFSAELPFGNFRPKAYIQHGRSTKRTAYLGWELWLNRYSILPLRCPNGSRSNPMKGEWHHPYKVAVVGR